MTAERLFRHRRRRIDRIERINAETLRELSVVLSS
jgi:hypothetical protein